MLELRRKAALARIKPVEKIVVAGRCATLWQWRRGSD
jgi:hypothetical protein